MKGFFIVQFLVLLLAMFLRIATSDAARLKDISNIRGVRENQLIGYGLVVGLKGTGDGKSEYTSKSFIRMLATMGVKLNQTDIESKNVAAVLVTATLPEFAHAGNKIDITVHSIGDATSLQGGTLVQTPLRAANQQVYAVAQGPVIVGTDATGKGQLTVARSPNAAMIERDVETDFASRKMLRLALRTPDFTTAARVSYVVNSDLGGKYAVAKDSATVDVIVPPQYEGNVVELMATIESLEVNPDTKAKVVINEKTGTVVIGEQVRISKIAISHGNISVLIGGTTSPVVAKMEPLIEKQKSVPSKLGPQPEPLKQEPPASTQGDVNLRGPASVESKINNVNEPVTNFSTASAAPGVPAAGPNKKSGANTALIGGEANVGDIVKALNTLGISPKDLITILQNIKAAGALQGELEIL